MDTNAIIEPFLSSRGRKIFYPRQGLLLQGQQASGTNINATIGVAFDDQGEHFCYSYLRELLPNLSAAELVGYASSFGIAPLREEWRKQLIVKNPSLASKAFSLPVVTAAITHSLAVAAYLFIEEGTPLLLPELFWPNYRMLFTQGYGADFRTHTTFANGSYNLAGLDQLLSAPEERKVVLLNCPNNPTGYSLKQTEMDQLAAILQRHAATGQKIILLCDDAYFGLAYHDDIAQESAFAQLATLHPNLLVVKHDGVTKEEFGWGLRIGFISFAGAALNPEALNALADKAGAVVRGSISNISRLSQELVLRQLTAPTRLDEQQSYRRLLKQRFLRLELLLKQRQQEAQEFFTLLPCNSGYFLALELKQENAEALRQRLLKHYSTGVISLGESYIRLAFSTVREQDFEQLIDNLLAACRDVFSSR